MSSLPTYQGKAVAYLDQNILDVFVKYGMIDFACMLRDTYQVVYSDETLKEIKRSGDYAEKFLDVLNNLNAFHIKQRLTNLYEPTNEITISQKDSYLAYKEYCDQLPVYQKLLNSMMQTIFKTYGGRRDDDFNIIKNEQLDAFSLLIEHIDEQSEIIKEINPDLAIHIKEAAKISMQQMEHALEKSTALMSASINEQDNWSGVIDFREAMKIGPKELNNISHPNVLQKIWDLYKEKDEYKDLNWSTEDFFFIKSNPINVGKPYFNYQKVNCIYNHLNLIGYYPDSETHRERRFIAAISDQSHASIASFADIVFSRDERFVKKVRAAYEHLEINTAVILVTLDRRGD